MQYEDCTNLERILQENPYFYDAIVIDCETTGIGHYEMVGGHERRNYILQLSIISAHDGTKLFNGYFKPRIKSWPEASRINGITWETVKNMPTFKHELPKIQKIITKAKVIIGYNVSFDLGFLDHEGIVYDDDKIIIDVMEDYAAFVGDMHDYFHTYTWKKLVVAAARAGFDWKSCPAEAHNSWADCLATLHVARWLQMQNVKNGWEPYYPPCYGYEGKFDCGDDGDCLGCKWRSDA